MTQVVKSDFEWHYQHHEPLQLEHSTEIPPRAKLCAACNSLFAKPIELEGYGPHKNPFPLNCSEVAQNAINHRCVLCRMIARMLSWTYPNKEVPQDTKICYGFMDDDEVMTSLTFELQHFSRTGYPDMAVTVGFQYVSPILLD